MEQTIDELLENEWFIVRHSGETPEIAYNSAIYFLTRSKEGPGLDLKNKQISWLKNGAIDRFRDIVLRDLEHGNAEKPMYRGIKRSIVNFQRFKKFCSRQKIVNCAIKQDAAQALIGFIARELHELEKIDRSTLFNCTFEELLAFADELEVGLGEQSELLRHYLPSQVEVLLVPYT